MKPSTIVLIIIAILVVAGAVWWGSSYYGYGNPNPAGQYQNQTGSTQGSATSTSSGVPGNNLTLGTSASAALGTYLVAYNGMTLYTYAPDGNSVSKCTGSCATAWPPYTVTPTANLVGESPIGGSIGTLVRTDTGATQVTYNGHPLYFYKGDTAVGDTTGQGIGGVWYVLKP